MSRLFFQIGILVALLAVATLVTACQDGNEMQGGKGSETECPIGTTTGGNDMAEDMNVKLWLSFDEDGGTYVYDGTKHFPERKIQYVFNYSYTKDKSEPIRRKGVLGNALVFDGYSNQITYKEQVSVDNNLTVSAWIAPRMWSYPDGTVNAIVCQANQALKSGFLFGYSDYGSLVASIGLADKDGRGKWTTVSCDEALTLWEWSYVTLVFNGEEGRIILYVNGKEVADRNVGSGFAVNLGDEALTVGGNPMSGIHNGYYQKGFFCGMMDELKISGDAWSAKQIAEAYALGFVDGAHPQATQTSMWTDPSVLTDSMYRTQYHPALNQYHQGEIIAPFYYNGKYHLFCQAHTNYPTNSHATWGHFVSDDMVNWTEVTPALVPGNNDFDPHHCFSGAAYIGKDQIPYLFYTGVNLNIKHLNRISYATPVDLSDDLLLNWTKYGSPILTQPDSCSSVDFRDPYLYEENGYVYMLLGTSTANGSDYMDGDPVVVCYRAKEGDFTNWEYLGYTLKGCYEENAALGYCWELPVLFKLTNDSGTVTKYLLALNPKGDVVRPYTYYWLGDFDLETGVFTPDNKEPKRIDYGESSMTACGFTDPVSQQNIIWSCLALTHGTTAEDSYNAGWENNSTLPRVLSLNDDGTLKITPLKNYEVLHGKTLADLTDVTVPEANDILKSSGSNMLHIKLTFDMSSAEKAGIKLLVKENRDGSRESLSIWYDKSTEKVYFDGSQCGSLSSGPASAVVPMKDNLITLEIYLDVSAVEIFAGERAVLTNTVHSTATEGGIVLFSEQGEVGVNRLEVYEMSSIRS